MTDERWIRDRARDLWAVEEAGDACGGDLHVLRYRHELGYETLVAVAPRLRDLSDAELEAALEAAKRVRPRAAWAAAA